MIEADTSINFSIVNSDFGFFFFEIEMRILFVVKEMLLDECFT